MSRARAEVVQPMQHDRLPFRALKTVLIRVGLITCGSKSLEDT